MLGVRLFFCSYRYGVGVGGWVLAESRSEAAKRFKASIEPEYGGGWLKLHEKAIVCEEGTDYELCGHVKALLDFCNRVMSEHGVAAEDHLFQDLYCFLSRLLDILNCNSEG